VALAGVLAGTLLGTFLSSAQAADSGWTPSNWTGVVPGAPVPGTGLPPAATPAQPAPVPVADIAPTYEGQAVCDPNPKPGTLRAVDLIKATYGAAQQVFISRGCDVGDQSEHKEGRAFDWMVNVRNAQDRANAESFLNWLLATDAAGIPYANAMRMGVMYIGWNDRMWRGYDTGRGWAELKGCFSSPQPASDTTCHRNHIHISLSWDGAAGTTSMWTGSPITAPYCPRVTSGASTKYPEAHGDMIPIGPVRVLDTRAAIGVPMRCRLEQDRWAGDSHRIFPKITGVGGIPASNVGSVRVRVTAQGANVKQTVRVWSPGQSTSQPVVEVGMNADASGEATVPVSTDGTIALATSQGATDLVVEVLGYYKADASGPAGQPGSSPPPAQTVTPASPPPLEPEPDDFHPVGSVLGYETGADGPMQAGETRTVSLAGLPNEARSAIVFVTAKEASMKGFVRIGRSAADDSAQMKFPKARMKKSVMIVPVSGSSVVFSASPTAAVQLRVEVLGYATSDRTPAVVAMTPREIMKGKITPATPLSYKVANNFGLPKKSKFRGVLLRVQTKKATADGTLAVYASGGTPPDTRSAPVVANTKYAAIVLAPIGPDGRVQVSSTVPAKFVANLIGYVK